MPCCVQSGTHRAHIKKLTETIQNAKPKQVLLLFVLLFLVFYALFIRFRSLSVWTFFLLLKNAKIILQTKWTQLSNKRNLWFRLNQLFPIGNYRSHTYIILFIPLCFISDRSQWVAHNLYNVFFDFPNMSSIVKSRSHYLWISSFPFWIGNWIKTSYTMLWLPFSFFIVSQISSMILCLWSEMNTQIKWWMNRMIRKKNKGKTSLDSFQNCFQFGELNSFISLVILSQFHFDRWNF